MGSATTEVSPDPGTSAIGIDASIRQFTENLHYWSGRAALLRALQGPNFLADCPNDSEVTEQRVSEAQAFADQAQQQILLLCAEKERIIAMRKRVLSMFG